MAPFLIIHNTSFAPGIHLPLATHCLACSAA